MATLMPTPERTLVPTPEEERLIERIDHLEARNVERHQEVLRRLTAVEVQTTATNGRVGRLELEQAVEQRLKEQERHYDVTIKRDMEVRAGRSRAWWMLVFAASLGFMFSLVLTFLNY